MPLLIVFLYDGRTNVIHYKSKGLEDNFKTIPMPDDLRRNTTNATNLLRLPTQISYLSLVLIKYHRKQN